MAKEVKETMSFHGVFGMYRPDHPRPGLECPESDARTRQEFRDECDINLIVARHQKTGVVSHINTAPPQFLDVSDVASLATALQTVAAANEAFMALPAVARASFDNDPVRFVDFAMEPDNLPKLREWGLAPPEKVPDAPMRVEVVNAPADKGGAS